MARGSMIKHTLSRCSEAYNRTAKEELKTEGLMLAEESSRMCSLVSLVTGFCWWRR